MEGDRNPDQVKVVLGALARVPRRDRARVEAGARAMLGMNVGGVVRRMRAAQKRGGGNKYLWIFAGVVLLFIIGMVRHQMADPEKVDMIQKLMRLCTDTNDLISAGEDSSKINLVILTATGQAVAMVSSETTRDKCVLIAITWAAILAVFVKVITGESNPPLDAVTQFLDAADRAFPSTGSRAMYTSVTKNKQLIRVIGRQFDAWASMGETQASDELIKILNANIGRESESVARS